MTGGGAEGVRPGLRIMGIDPGLADVGYGIVEADAHGRARVVDFGVIRTTGAMPFPDRLALIHQRVGELVERFAPEVVAVEELFFAKNVKTAMVVAHGRAAAILGAAGRGIKLVEFTPLQIKQGLTGHGRAGKLQVQSMVRVVLGLAEVPRPDHAADALAAALCYLHSIALTGKVERALGAVAAAERPAAGEPTPAKLLLMRARTGRKRRFL